MDLEFSGQQILLATCSIVLFLFMLTKYLKRSFIIFSNSGSSNSGETNHSSTRNKFQYVDVYKKSGDFLRLGLLCSMTLVFLLINWTIEKPVIDLSFNYNLLEVQEVEVVPPRVSASIPPPAALPSPPTPIVNPVSETKTEVVEKPILVPEEKPISNTTVNVPNPPVENNSTSSNNSQNTSTKEESFPMIVEQMPRFPGCEELVGDNKAKEICSKEKLQLWIKKNLSYPLTAQKNKIEGEVYVQFVVDTDGSISRIKVVKDPGAGLGDAAKALVESMNRMPEKWIPGKQAGKALQVRFTLPIKFKLNDIKRN
jgi:periplasmic protein TonB